MESKQLSAEPNVIIILLDMRAVLL